MPRLARSSAVIARRLCPPRTDFSAPSCRALGTVFVPMTSRRIPQWAQPWAQVYADSIGTCKPIAEQKARIYAGFQWVLRKASDYAGMLAIDAEYSEQPKSITVAWFFCFQSGTWEQIWEHFLKSPPILTDCRRPASADFAKQIARKTKPGKAGCRHDWLRFRLFDSPLPVVNSVLQFF